MNLDTEKPLKMVYIPDKQRSRIPMSISLLMASHLHGEGNLTVNIIFKDTNNLVGRLWGVTQSSEGIIALIGTLENKSYYYTNSISECDIISCDHCTIGDNIV